MVRDSCERKGRGSLLFSPSLLGGHDNYQTRPDSALASSSLAVRHFSWSLSHMHAALNLPVFKERRWVVGYPTQDIASGRNSTIEVKRICTNAYRRTQVFHVLKLKLNLLEDKSHKTCKTRRVQQSHSGPVTNFSLGGLDLRPSREIFKFRGYIY